MNGAPLLKQLAHRVMTQQIGASQDPDELASAAVKVYTRLLTTLSPLLGDIGSPALLRRSLRLTEAAFPCYAEVRVARQEDLLPAVGACLRTQALEAAREASIALLIAYLELLAIFIGERLTRQLLQQAWPDIGSSLSQEMHE